MAVRIRLKRIGRKNRPFYRVCVFDSRTRRDGAPIEELGSYDPRARALGNKVSLNADRAAHWLKVGAKPTETVGSIFRALGISAAGQDPARAEAVAQEAAATDESAPAAAATPPRKAPVAAAVAAADAAPATPADEAGGSAEGAGSGEGAGSAEGAGPADATGSDKADGPDA